MDEKKGKGRVGRLTWFRKLQRTKTDGQNATHTHVDMQTDRDSGKKE